MQKWSPKPNVTWWSIVRRTSKRSGSSNWCSSRLAAAFSINRIDPSGTVVS